MQTDKFTVRKFPSLENLPIQVSNDSHKMRVCIATEEIYGPVRNGGIASTYHYLARMLAKQGYEVTVLFLKGAKSEVNSFEYWVEFYAEFGVSLVALPILNNIHGMSFWQRRQASAYIWLKNQITPFDIVHASEWRGGAHYALLAKQQGLAFRDTLFVIKASSPHIWNRHYIMEYMANIGLLTTMYAEQTSIELGDIVIGGSAHLLSFMDHVGYKVPEQNTFVQPNIIELDVEAITDQRNCDLEDVIQSKEIVFFGRLEVRKGLSIFCDALDFLTDRNITPKKVVFMGKEGGNLPTDPNTPCKDHIRMRASYWPFEVEIIDTFQQKEAIGYLLEKERLAVMPSLIENSTMAVYEALIYKIPFLATNTGGTPELIHPDDRDDVLCEANPKSLADGMERLLTRGGKVARCAFDNYNNITIWKQFHKYLNAMAAKGKNHTLSRVEFNDTRPSLSICAYYPGSPENLQNFVDEIIGNCEEEVTQVIIAAERLSDDQNYFVETEIGHDIQFVSAREMSLGEAWNMAAQLATGEVLFFLRGDIHTPLNGFAATLKTVFANSDGVAFSSFWNKQELNQIDPITVAPIGYDQTMGILYREAISGNAISIRNSIFEGIGGFNTVYGVSGIQQDLLHRAAEKGQVRVIPETLYVENGGNSRLRLNEHNAQFLSVDNIMNTSSYPMRRIHLMLGSYVQNVTPPEIVNRLRTGTLCDPATAEFDFIKSSIFSDDIPGLIIGCDADRTKLFFRLADGKGRFSVLIEDENESSIRLKSEPHPEVGEICIFDLRKFNGPISLDISTLSCNWSNIDGPLSTFLAKIEKSTFLAKIENSPRVPEKLSKAVKKLRTIYLTLFKSGFRAIKVKAMSSEKIVVSSPDGILSSEMFFAELAWNVVGTQGETSNIDIMLVPVQNKLVFNWPKYMEVETKSPYISLNKTKKPLVRNDVEESFSAEFELDQEALKAGENSIDFAFDENEEIGSLRMSIKRRGCALKLFCEQRIAIVSR